MSERGYLSIGEVLLLLQEEFQDLTISKIRFLESQGLIEPERTASGYRKFYDQDVERLRFVLREQKDHYLPLRVIKDRLEGGEATGPLGRPPDTPGPPPLRPPAWSVLPGAGEGGGAPSRPADPSGPIERPAGEPAPIVRPAPAAFLPADLTAPSGTRRPVDAPSPAPVAPHAAPSVAALPGGVPPPTGPSGDRTFTLDELVVATGLGRTALRELEDYGLIAGHELAGEITFDGWALDIATVAAGLLGHGLEPRHLRMYRQGADREVSLFEQVVMPLLKQRNPEARARAGEDLADLARLGAALREVLVRQALRPHLH